MKLRMFTLAAALLASPSSHAGTYHWTGTTSGAWNASIPANWNATTPTFDNTADLFFGKTVAIKTYNTWLGTPASGTNITVHSLTFDGTIDGYTAPFVIRLDNNGTTARTLTFGTAGASVNLLANVTQPVTIGNATYAYGTIVLNNTFNVVNHSTQLLTIGRPIGDNANPWTITKSGTGTLVLSGANTFTGNVTVNAGTLDVRNTAALGTKTGTRTTVAAGASLVLGAASLNFQGEQVTVSGTGADGLGVIKNTSGAQLQNAFDKVILAGDATFSADSRFDIRDPAHTGLVAMDLAGFTLTKTGTNFLYFDGCTISSGDIVVAAGQMGFQNGVIVAAKPGDTVTLKGGTDLRFWRSATGQAACTFARDIIAEDGATISWSGNNTTDEVDQSVASPINITGTVTLNQSGTSGSIFDLAGVISGTGGITRTGAGILRLSAANTYSGPTDLQDGITQLTGSIPGVVTIGSAGTLEGTGSVTGLVTVTGKLHFNGSAGTAGGITALAGGTLNPAGPATAGSIQTASLALTDSNLILDSASPALTDSIVIAANGAFTATGLTNVEVIAQGDWRVADYPLIRYSGTTTAPAADPNTYFFPKSRLGHATGSLVDTGGVVLLRITAAPSNPWTGVTDGNWDTTVANWQLPGNLYLDGDSVVFNDTATGNFAVNLDTTVSPGSVTFNHSLNGYSVSSSTGIGGIAGLGTLLTKSGTGRLTMGTTNSYAGGTTINNGTLALLRNATNEAPSLGSGPLVINAPGVFEIGINGTVANAISGDGAVLKSYPDAGTFTTLSGNNSYTGLTTVMDGSLGIGSPTALGTAGTGTVVADAARLSIGSPLANNSTISEPITLQGGANVVLPDFHVINSKTGIVMNGAVSIQNDAVLSFDVGTSLDFAVGISYSGGGTGANVTVQGAGNPALSGPLVLGTGSLIHAGPGTLTLSHAGNGFADTTVNSGTLTLTGAGTLGSGTNTVAAGAFITLSGALASPFNKALTGVGILLKTGAGNAELAAVNGLTGGTQVDAGLLLLGSDGLLGTGPLNLNGGAVVSKDATPRTVSNPVVLNTSPAFGDIAGVLNAPVTYTGNVSFPVTKWVRIYTPTTWAGGSGGTGMTQKLGAGTLTLKGTHDWSLGTTHELREGTEILDGATLTSADAVRVLCTAAGGTARLSLINGSSVTVLLGTANLRLGYAGGNATATNILDVGGTLTLPAGSTGGKVMMGDSSTANTLNLNAGGNLLTAAIQDTNAAATDVVNCNGGKLTVILDSTNTAATGFMQGLNAVNLLDGGLVIDTNGNPALINQAMQAGGTNIGGLTKQGAGTLSLGGANVYGGPTVVAAGTLAVVSPGATGLGATTVQSGATLAGNGIVTAAATIEGSISPGTSIGALTVGGRLTLAAGSAYNWEVTNWNAVLQGLDYDTIVAGSLDITATAGNPATIVVNGLSLSNFVDAPRTFVLATITGGITSFAASKFVVNRAAFTAGTGAWTVKLSGDSTKLLLEYAPAAANDYDSWADGFGLVGLDREPGADPDHDGLTNFQEYAFGLIPTSGASVSPVKVPLNRTTGHFTYTRRDPALTLLAYGIEKSTTLAAGGWALDNGATQNVISTVDRVQTVEVTLSGTPPVADPTLFVRVVAQK
jgi:autotransporter-associated beta strand protein